MNGEYRVGQLLSRAQWAMKQHVNFRLKERGLGYVTIGFLGALEALWSENALNMGQLAERAGLEKSTITGLIDRMERSGLIRREADRNDRRAIRILLTPKGESVKDDVAAAVRLAYEDLAVGLTAAEVDTAVKVLEGLIENSRKGYTGNP